jgi:enoyl-CoA hydratase
VNAIMARLDAERGPHAAWAQAVAGELASRSPMSLVITLRHLCAAAAMDLRQTLMLDYRLAIQCIATPDFTEGVRAAVVDKDHAPRWRPQTLDEVAPAFIERVFYFNVEDELQLPTRQEMQMRK